MNPTRTLDTADFSLHRVLFSSRQRIERTYSSSTNFKCQIDLPRNVDIFRFAIRRVTFPNVACQWDLQNPPYLYYRLVATAAVIEYSEFDIVYRVPLRHKWTTKEDVAKVHGGTSPAFGLYNLMMNLDGVSSGGATVYKVISGTVPDVAGYNKAMTGFDIEYASKDSSNLTFSLKFNAADVRMQLLGVSEELAGGDQFPSHYANSILGVSASTKATTDGAYLADDVSMTFPVNLSGNLHVYLTSTVLSATARSTRPIFASVENCLAAIPVASTYLTLVDHRPEAPTVWSCNQDNHWDVVDFQLRYDTGGIVDLGGNDIEIEIEFEVMEQFNAPSRQMQEAIYLPNVNVYDTTKLLLKRDNRSWGSYGGRTGAGQFMNRGPSGGVYYKNTGMR